MSEYTGKGTKFSPPPPYSECVVSPSAPSPSSFCPHLPWYSSPCPFPTSSSSSSNISIPPMDPDIRSALERHFQQKSWLKQKSLRKMTITEIQSMPAYSYYLHYTMEQRIVSVSDEPYRNQYIDGKNAGVRPSKWDIQPALHDPTTRSYSWYYMIIPHSESVQECPECCGDGKVICDHCLGNNQRTLRCANCMGSGKVELESGYNVRCRLCLASGEIENTCHVCRGGKIKCERCLGHKSLKYWETVQVTLKTDSYKWYTKREDLKEEKLREATKIHAGTSLERTENPGENQEPLLCDESWEITYQAGKAVGKMFAMQSSNLIIKKYTQVARKIPVKKVSYIWKDEVGYFFIYGDQEKVYFPKRFQYRNKLKCVIM